MTVTETKVSELPLLDVALRPHEVIVFDGPDEDGNTEIANNDDYGNKHWTVTTKGRTWAIAGSLDAALRVAYRHGVGEALVYTVYV